ncbi:site-specific integrase [Bradyrhizobium sp. CB1650]|uniref:tyrosine-type recombinase/integrase n=1 Tax=Bradyrhizobium sp. CB1650 TaxID=3039153 RepID=UPI0024353554|nr:site-specific integrase [Bradyrhizobium sp. CB1650]WGD56098.1 site-specific integrase [Bradyrhizobium sp. CB1650]
MSWRVRQHYHGGRRDLLVQVHRPADRQAAHRLARHLQSGNLHRRGCPQQGLRPQGHGRRRARRDLPRPEGCKSEARQDRRGDHRRADRVDEDPVKKPDGEMRPRLESWENTASHLDRFIRPRLGKKLAMEVTKHDIATLSNDIVAGKFGKPSVSNARHMRKAASGLFNWAAEAGRDYVTASPCVNLPKLDPEHPRTRVLSEDEIRIFWHGLDRDDLPYDRRTCLALKFELVTMLRSRELLGAHRDELFDLDREHARFDVPLKRVKKRRVIQQPLSDLAVEIIKEALTSDDQQFVFESPMYKGQPIHRKAMADALRGTKHEKNKDKTKTAGLCELLGLKPFTPHDLRRTAATLAGDLGFDDAWIAKCLDHAASKKSEQNVPTVTGKVYNHSKRMKEKRAVLDGVAAELRRIVGAPAAKAAGPRRSEARSLINRACGPA